MKAAIVERYGGPEVAVIKDVPKPTPKEHEILIRVTASAVNSGDARIRRADPWFVRLAFGFFGPRKKILGTAYAGIVEAVGKKVTNAQVGDRVYGMSEDFLGCHAEYLVVAATAPRGLIPDSMSFTDAAALTFGGTTALHFLDLMDVKGKSMLLIGASGAVGSTVLQIAKARGAHVTAVTSNDNASLMQSLGADQIIDYKKTNVLDESTTYDIVFDCVNAIPVNRIQSLAKQGGDIVLLAALMKEMFQSRSIKNATVHVGTAKVLKEQYTQLNDLYATGKLKPVISHTFALNEIQKAYKIVDSGKKVGTIIISL